jgi:hypothetical protein
MSSKDNAVLKLVEELWLLTPSQSLQPLHLLVIAHVFRSDLLEASMLANV